MDPLLKGLIFVAKKCGDPKLLAVAMMSYPGVEDLNNGNYALKDLEVFGPATR